MLDIADSEGRDHPRPSEILDLAANGVGARIAAVLPAAARERAARFALATGLAWSLLYFLIEDWMPWAPAAHRLAPQPFGVFNSPGVIVTTLWTAAIMLLWAGQVAAARITLLASAGAAVVIVALQPPTPSPTFSYPSPDRPTFVLLAALALVASAGRPRRHWSTLATAGGWGIALSGFILTAHQLDRTAIPQTQWRWWWYDFFGRYLWQAPAAVLTVITAALILAAIVNLAGRRTAAATIVFSLAPWAAAALAAYAISWTGWAPTSRILQRLVIMAVAWAIASAVVLIVRRTRGLERGSHGTPDPA
ncbi:hypothetical protein ACFOYW_00280 [Gryllotalpicola reticulitermitis]|uniref:Integral membrane protein n=1 Tax=Gryllotalpicola reticulitermitis TaxID=1184153 RepID=A0ABV8Q017_9MICO